MAVTVATDAHAVVVEEVGKGLCRYGMCAFGECRKHYLAYELVASLRLTSAEKYPKAAYRLVSATETVECQPVGQHFYRLRGHGACQEFVYWWWCAAVGHFSRLSK